MASTLAVASDVTEVRWDLETLLPRPGRDGVTDLLADAEELAAQLEAYRGTVATMSSAELAAALELVAALQDRIGRAGNYASLHHAIDTRDASRSALMAEVEERSTALFTRLVFFELEWAALDDDRVEDLLSSDDVSDARHYLRSMRRYRDHLLSEPEEVLMAEKSVTGSNAFARLFSELTSVLTVEIDGEAQPLDVGLSLLQSSDADVRRAAAEQVTATLEPGLRTRSFIYNTLLADKATDDRLRGYGGWVSSRNLANEASDESVQALVEAVVGRYSIAQRWYDAKAAMLGVDQLDDWDRYASIAEDETEYSWPAACEVVRDAYRSFSGEIAEVVDEFLANPWIDAAAREGKRGGAFCAYTVPSHHPYVMLNWTSTRRDVLTLAHELGHGVHAYLARRQGIFHQDTPLTVAETASVFGETVTFGRLVADATEPSDRLPLLSAHLEDQIATVFRQIAMWRFEDAAHTERRTVGELAPERFGELWAETQAEMLGSSVRISEGYRTWWSYIPHVIHTPGYVYAYAYGQLLALSVYARYEEAGESFVSSYVELLAAGGSMSPEDLGRIVGVDLADPGFWDGGLDIIERQLDATLAAASDAGRL